jgi:hypothetical protein
MEKIEYNLTYLQAFEVIMNGGCVKGSGFRDGIFMRLNTQCQLVVVERLEHGYADRDKVFLGGFKNQMYRELTVLTKIELSK